MHRTYNALCIVTNKGFGEGGGGGLFSFLLGWAKSIVKL